MARRRFAIRSLTVYSSRPWRLLIGPIAAGHGGITWPFDDVEFAILLGEYDPGGRYRVRCSGQVVRVEEIPNAFAVAERLHSYSL